MRAGIITIGTELLLGDILNTNQKFLSSLLTSLGIEVYRHISVGDYEKPMKEAIKKCMDDCDIILLSGGLGPTEDDCTKEYLSEVIQRPLEKNEDEYKKMVELFQRKNYTLTKNNLKQIYTIKDSVILHNEWGTAPGEYVKYKNVHIFIFPGPPTELEPMAKKYLPSLIFDKTEIYEKSIQIMGLGESAVETRLRTLDLPKSLEINTFAHFGSVEIKIIGKSSSTNQVNIDVQRSIEIIKEEFASSIYSLEGNMMEEEIIKRCMEKNLKIAFAESVTGGLLVKRITSYPNASNILHASVVTYSNQSKEEILKVPRKDLETYGAVSEKVAMEMARGLYELGYCDIAISTTGEAGPIPSEKPIGTVYIGFYNGKKYRTKKLHLNGSRREIQKRIATVIFTELLKVELGGNNGN
ncbi:MAG: competence/damage-inducible protein A [Tissierellia bacterium]|nr:competence/damage-inducible protein A [Tissierellia bacterium]